MMTTAKTLPLIEPSRLRRDRSGPETSHTMLSLL